MLRRIFFTLSFQKAEGMVFIADNVHRVFVAFKNVIGCKRVVDTNLPVSIN